MFMGKPIRIEGMLNFVQDPANKALCRDTSKELEVPAVIDGGVLNEMAVGLVTPQFPANAAGNIVEARVQVVIDEQGKVISATILDGDKAFGEAAMMASKNVTFPRSVIAGTPVKVQGILEFKRDRSVTTLTDSPIKYAGYLMY
jgi:TonB family protein